MLTNVILKRFKLFLSWTCVKISFKEIGNKMSGSSSFTEWLPTEWVHIQMIYVWLYVSLGNHQNRASLFNLCFHTATILTHTLTKKYLNFIRFVDQYTRLILQKSYLYYIPYYDTIIIVTMCPEFPRRSRLIVFFFSTGCISTLIF